ncbi:hypothetical protein L1987_18608 [Smallanthus sonchifolius]|uniref:Uncharacterized protein n=1 Tax=Smallanthus sonchifolius TaxID=185202 RepID=A0ACB9J2F5_9ASTR|nr:hypothetical protein L1987_18608 [Smallanthus sonchifolius]
MMKLVTMWVMKKKNTRNDDFDKNKDDKDVGIPEERNGDSNVEGGKGNGGHYFEFNIEWSESNKDESVSEADLENLPPNLEKDGLDDKIIYETVDGQMIETNLSLDRSKWFKPLLSTLEPLVHTIKAKKTHDTSKIIS